MVCLVKPQDTDEASVVNSGCCSLTALLMTQTDTLVNRLFAHVVNITAVPP
jgi:hypothetical protein